MRTCCKCGAAFDELRLRDRLCKGCRSPVIKKRYHAGPITPREEMIIAAVAEAKDSKTIAFELGLAEGTVKEYLNRIYHKLQIHNRTALAVWALRKEHGARSG